MNSYKVEVNYEQIEDNIENCEKPFESNHELQREFLEKNVDHYKGKINTMNKIFVNDHSKVIHLNHLKIHTKSCFRNKEKYIIEKYLSFA